MIHFPAVNDEFGKNVGRDEMNLAEFRREYKSPAIVQKSVNIEFLCRAVERNGGVVPLAIIKPQ